MFRIADLGATASGASRYLASADGSRGPCQFELVIERPKAESTGPFAFTRASLKRRAASDCTSFLRSLARQLEFTGDLPEPHRVQALDCELAILGTDQSRSGHGEIAGGFSSTPPGPWTAAKLFLAEGEGEVFLNLNARDGVGEFSIKDEDYASVVVTELAKILLPDAS